MHYTDGNPRLLNGNGGLTSWDENRVNCYHALGRVRSWRIPPTWSYKDWVEEISAVAICEAYTAESLFDPSQSIPLQVFVRSRVLARALSRYRQEWAFARRRSQEQETKLDDFPEMNSVCDPAHADCNWA